ncbi:MAG: ABC transporter substrate-binding protein [Ruminococcus sp.]|nr:ABC transporter substrate-binding protein [Ruminococcus sp.]MDE6426883.1 ABC transporter substrate-binding protein [Ruminococcus sp.]
MKSVKKITSFILAMTIASALFLTGCGKNDKNEEYVFRIGTANGSLCLAPLHVAEDNGYFEEEFQKAGIKYELVEIDIQQTADMITSGKIDACVGLAGSFIPQIDSGLEIAFTTGIHTGCTKYYVSADSDINDMSDLKGKKIGVPGMSDSSVVALKRILHDLEIGVSTDNMEIELVVYNLTDLPLALANGAVDAVALHDPVAASAEAEYGFTKIFDLTEDGKFANEYCCAGFVTTSVASEHPEAAAAYTRALMKASAYVQAEPENSAKLQIENDQCSGDLENNAKLLASYNYQPSVSVMEDTFRNSCTDLLEIGDLKEGRDINKFTSEHIAQFDDVPDSYIYNADGTFSSIDSKKKQ